MPKQIAGVLPVVHTPFFEDETIDYESLQREIDWAYAQGADGYCTGMVSEILRLTSAERIELNGRLAELNAGRGVFVAGVGAESTRQASEYAHAAQQAGCDAIMAISPISTALPDSQLLEYFGALARQTQVPLVVQSCKTAMTPSLPVSFLLDEPECAGKLLEGLKVSNPSIVLPRPRKATARAQNGSVTAAGDTTSRSSQ